jgi:hypothetical protein
MILNKTFFEENTEIMVLFSSGGANPGNTRDEIDILKMP